MKEDWKDIKGFEGRFMISNTGKILSIQHRTSVVKVLNPAIDSGGYFHTSLRMKPKYLSERVHVLVAKHFLPPIEGKTQVNHIDGDKLNNDVSNLEWCTQSENSLHAWRTGLTNTHGENSPRAKLKREDVLKIRALANEGFSRSQIKAKLGLCINERHISDIVNRVNWKSV